jgi:hypothetical protein
VVDDAPLTPRRDVVLIADASAEGQVIATALRARGFAVAFAPIERLEARVLEEAPRVLLVDIDQPGARDAIERLRELPGGQEPELCCLGSLARAAEVGATSASGRAFERPLDVHAILAHVAALAEPAPLEDSIVDDGLPEPPRAKGETLPPAMPDDLSGQFVSAFPSAFPGAPDPLDLGSLFPAEHAEGDAGAPPTALQQPTQLSPDLMALLAAAEKRVLSDLPPSSPAAGAEEEVDLVLADEFLAVLEEPLDADDEEPGTGPDLGQSGGLDPGTGPNPLVGETTGALPSVDAERSLVDPLAGASLAASSPGGPPSPVPTPAPRQSDPAVTIPQVKTTAPRSVEAKSYAEGPSTAWDMSRFSRPIDEPTPTTRHLAQPPQTSVGRPPLTSAGRAPLTSAGRAPLTSAERPQPAPAQRPPPPPVADALPISPPPTPALATTPREATFIPPASAAASMRGPPPPTAPSLASRALVEPPSMPPVLASAGEKSPGASRPVEVLGEGDAPRSLARAIAERSTGALAFHAEGGVRRVVLQDGDIVTAGSGFAEETLLAFLSARGDIEREVALRLAGKLPPSGRHAGAALIAHGYLAQDALWPVLRAHAEWLIGRAIATEKGTVELEAEPPGRLRAEPNVFGGATGAEVFVEVVRRVVPPDLALARLGGRTARIDHGAQVKLLGECALRSEEEALVIAARGASVGEVLARGEPDIAALFYALACLSVIVTLTPSRPASVRRPAAEDPLDEEAIRMRVRARMALVEDGDYFAVLGIPRDATSYEIRRAYLDLRRSFEPSRILTAATADLADDVRLVIEVLDEAYEILRDGHRRERYRRAIEAGPPA